MLSQLKMKTEYWMSLERGTDEQKKAADEYYDKELMPLIIQSFVERELPAQKEKPEHMILSVGTSYEPLVLSLSVMTPKRILFLYTDETENEIDRIVECLNLKPRNYNKQKVDKTNSLIIYQVIKQAYLNWGKPPKIYIDFTSGTKAMSAATAMAGAILGAQLVYISNHDYLSNFRRPRPGSEYLERIPNPYTVFGALDEDRAFDLFAQHDYTSARKIFENLQQRVPEPVHRQYYKNLYLLAASYEHWDSIEFEKALDFMARLVAELERDSELHRELVLMDCVTLLKEQKKILDILAKNASEIKSKPPFDILLNQEEILPLLFTIYRNAMRRKEQSKYDMASLLLYRLLEMIMQRRMAVNGIYVNKPDYKNIEQRYNGFRERVELYGSKVFGGKISSHLPEYNISLMEGYIQLAGLQDKLIDNRNPIQFLKNISNRVNARNNSIFAHGFKSMSEKEYAYFEEFVTGVFKRFCEIEEINMEEYDRRVTFINPAGTEYCQR